MHHDPTGSGILGIIMAALALLGLIMASRAEDIAFYATGLGLAAFGVAFIFALIRRHVGRPRADEAALTSPDRGPVGAP
jgi:hypothetical protein